MDTEEARLEAERPYTFIGGPLMTRYECGRWFICEGKKFYRKSLMGTRNEEKAVAAFTALH